MFPVIHARKAYLSNLSTTSSPSSSAAPGVDAFDTTADNDDDDKAVVLGVMGVTGVTGAVGEVTVVFDGATGFEEAGLLPERVVVVAAAGVLVFLWVPPGGLGEVAVADVRVGVFDDRVGVDDDAASGDKSSVYTAGLKSSMIIHFSVFWTISCLSRGCRRRI